MDRLVKVHIHPQSGKEIKGYRLRAGDEIKEGDVYNSTDGEWRDMQLSGLVIAQDAVAIWIRPAILITAMKPEESFGLLLTNAITTLYDIVHLGQVQQEKGRGNRRALVLQRRAEKGLVEMGLQAALFCPSQDVTATLMRYVEELGLQIVAGVAPADYPANLDED